MEEKQAEEKVLSQATRTAHTVSLDRFSHIFSSYRPTFTLQRGNENK
jgi:hypothetical protein